MRLLYHLARRETILPCDGGPFMGGGPASEPVLFGRAAAQRRTGADKFLERSVREEPRASTEGASTAGKKLGWRRFRRTGAAHRSYATSKGEMPPARETASFASVCRVQDGVDQSAGNALLRTPHSSAVQSV